jgi:glycosyltransferase involved in cell wall biosynthesis
MQEKKSLSIIIPVYNEEKNTFLLYNRLKPILESLTKDYEIIFIDDGSTDKTSEELKQLHEKDTSIKIIQFQRNFGKSAALSAGFDNAKGDIIITMDGDLEDDPNEIPNLLKATKDYDLVVGWRYKRKHTITKRIASKFFNSFINLSTGIKIHDSNCCLKAYKRKVIENINLYGELHRYIPSLAHWKGFKVGEIKVTHHKRLHGKSKYGIDRLFKGLMDLITVQFLMTFGKKPLHLFGFFGGICILTGFIAGLHLVYTRATLGLAISNRPLLMLTVLLIILGIQFFSIGLIGEIILNTTRNHRDQYIIREIIKN